MDTSHRSNLAFRLFSCFCLLTFLLSTSAPIPASSASLSKSASAQDQKLPWDPSLDLSLSILPGPSADLPGDLGAVDIPGALAYASQEWITGIWDTNVGKSGIAVLDIDGDGVQEIITGGGNRNELNNIWRIAYYDPIAADYRFEYISPEYPTPIVSIKVGDPSNDGHYHIYLWFADGTIEVYDAVTHLKLETIPALLGPYTSQAFTLADVDRDGAVEIVLGTYIEVVILDASTYAVEWKMEGAGASNLAIGNVDTDPALEIVTPHNVIDGASHAIEFSATFGKVATADIDGDGMDEIIGNSFFGGIMVYDADIQSLKWSLAVQSDKASLSIGDVDQDGTLDIVFESGSGDIQAIDSLTQQQKWLITNTGYGVNGLTTGDANGDGKTDVFWGTDDSLSTAGGLFVASFSDPTYKRILSSGMGPLSAMEVGDVDQDGDQEIVTILNGRNGDPEENRGQILVYDATTHELEWQSPLTLDGYTIREAFSLALADIDQDGRLEIVLPSVDFDYGVILAIDGVTHSVDWVSPKTSGLRYLVVHAADLDHDGIPEIIVGQDDAYNSDSGYFLRIYDPVSNVLEWCTTNLGWGIRDITSGDVDGDGNQEILFTDDSQAHIYENKTQIREWLSPQRAYITGAVLDIDADGEQEIVLGNATGLLEVYNGTTHELEWSRRIAPEGRPILSFRLIPATPGEGRLFAFSDSEWLYLLSLPSFEQIWKSPFLGRKLGNLNHLITGDIDLDGSLEMVIGTASNVYVFQKNPKLVIPRLSITLPVVSPGNLFRVQFSLTSISGISHTVAANNPIPVGTTLEPGSLSITQGAAKVEGNAIEWSLDLGPGDDASLTFQLRVAADVADRSVITDTITFAGPDGPIFLTTDTIVDAVRPWSAIATPDNYSVLKGDNVTITGSAQDDIVLEKVEIRINDGDWIEVNGKETWQYTWTLPSIDGLYKIWSRATDTAGNIGEAYYPTNVIIDNHFPTILSTLPANGAKRIDPTLPIVIHLSEPIKPSVEIDCGAPDETAWFEFSDQDTTLIWHHAPFAPDQAITCELSNIYDLAYNPSIPGDAPNPWTFTTSTSEKQIFIPVVTR